MSIFATAYIPLETPRVSKNPAGHNVKDFAPVLEYIAYDDRWAASVGPLAGAWHTGWGKTPGEAVDKLWARVGWRY